MRRVVLLSESWRCAESQMMIPDVAEIERIEAQSFAARENALEPRPLSDG